MEGQVSKVWLEHSVKNIFSYHTGNLLLGHKINLVDHNKH
jgi:hypothetical protein